MNGSIVDTKMSNSKIVKELAAEIRKAQRRGPKHFRKPPVAHEMHTGRMISNGHNSFSIYQIEKQLAAEDFPTFRKNFNSMYGGTMAGIAKRRKLAKKILKRALKKAAQPHRANHNRKAMRRKAAGKNEVR